MTDFADYLDEMSLGELDLSSDEDEIKDKDENQDKDEIILISIVKYNPIKYANKLKFANNIEPLEISPQEVDKHDFMKKPFIEVLKNPPTVHLYFDFDKITSEEEYLGVVSWLEEVKKVFGPYSIGGYSNCMEFAKKYGYKLHDKDSHFVSIHVVYYKTCIDSSELIEIMKFSEKKGGFWRYTVNEKIDPAVYKLSTRQIFRHVLSPKYYGPGDEKNRDNSGYILHGLKPLTQIVQVRGDETKIPREQWEKIFHPKETPTNQAKREREERKQAKQNNEKQMKIIDTEFTDKLIIMNKGELLELLDNFESHYNNIMTEVNALFNSPYEKDFLIDVLTEWYNKTTHNTPDNIANIVNLYYKKEESNKWFFTITRRLDPEKRLKYREEYAKSSINFDVNINNSKYCFEDIKTNRYSIYAIGRLLTYLRGVIGVVEGDRWYLKTKIDGQPFIKEIPDDKFMKKLRIFKPFKGNDNISLSQIVSKYSTYFIYDAAEVSKESKPKVINMFQGFKYQESSSNDFSMLEPFLNHIKHIICNDNADKYDYFMKWWANIFQNITVKNGTMPIIYGAQGSGKSFPIEVFCELFGKYALANVDDLDKVFGKFNGLIGRNLVVNLNEPPESNEKFKYQGKIKSKLTQRKTIQETKGVDQIEIQSWANYIMTTNNPNPIQEEKGDRRTIYFETNNSKCGDEEYFDKLCKPIQQTKQGEYNKEFMELLLHYMRTKIDLTDFNPERLIRQINNNTQTTYNEQLERQYLGLNAVDKYVVDNYERFVKGICLEQIYVEGYKSTGIARKLNAVCNVKRIAAKQFQAFDDDDFVPTTNRIRVYTLKPKEQIPDLYKIIEYIEFNKHPEPTVQEIASGVISEIVQKICQ